ncbi:MAG: arginyl-tRNA--protein-N-Asp/Glu arginylyltransferase [Gammaproteobacteria bacterium]|jgi:arginyl-tRNA--protein-N-Asp/Glu arginylyltransferase
MTSTQKLGFYSTPPHQCSYLPEQQAITLFADPQFPKNMRIYSTLMNNGFRRSGSHLYIPNCKNCSACISVRIPVDKFMPTRIQNRILKKNKDLIINETAAEFNIEHFNLYKKYISMRHAGGGMDNPTPENYMEFLTTKWADTVFFEMKVDNKLVAVAVTDILHDALSAVYTFFDPDLKSRSLGKFAIIFQIIEANLRDLSWHYLGYWIKSSDKMKYKSEFQPQQFFYNNCWNNHPLDTDMKIL